MDPALGDHDLPHADGGGGGEHFGLCRRRLPTACSTCPTKMHGPAHRGDDITILNDTWHQPQSMRGRLWRYSQCPGAYKVAVLGDIFELGPWPLPAGVGDYLGKAGIDCLVAVGELARHIHDAAQAGASAGVLLPTKAEARPVLDGVVRPMPPFWSRPPRHGAGATAGVRRVDGSPSQEA